MYQILKARIAPGCVHFRDEPGAASGNSNCWFFYAQMRGGNGRVSCKETRVSMLHWVNDLYFYGVSPYNKICRFASLYIGKDWSVYWGTFLAWYPFSSFLFCCRKTLAGDVTKLEMQLFCRMNPSSRCTSSTFSFYIILLCLAGDFQVSQLHQRRDLCHSSRGDCCPCLLRLGLSWIFGHVAWVSFSCFDKSKNDYSHCACFFQGVCSCVFQKRMG